MLLGSYPNNHRLDRNFLHPAHSIHNQKTKNVIQNISTGLDVESTRNCLLNCGIKSIKNNPHKDSLKKPLKLDTELDHFEINQT